LGNAVILAKPNSRFIKRWYNSYTTFDDNNWNYHSIVLPGRLASDHPDEIHLLDYSRFFWPLWNEKGLQKFYVEKVYDFGAMGYLNHLWESKALRFVLADTTPETVENVDLPLFCRMRKFLRISPPETSQFSADGAFVWSGLLDPSAEQHDAACQILDEPIRDDGLISRFDFEEDHALKLFDSTQHRLHGWFIDNRAWNNQTSNFTHFATFPSPFNQVRAFNGSWGSYAIVPTLRRRGLSFDGFTFSTWIRIDPVAALRQEKMAVLELIGDCDSFSATDKCPNLIVKLRKVSMEQAGNNQSFVVDAVIYEMRYGDPWIIVKLARIDFWDKDEKRKRDYLMPDVWYRIQISASRESQKLQLKTWDEKRLIARHESPYFVPSAILPSRIRSVWLGGPWRLYNNNRDFGEDFTGFLDRFVVVGRQVEDAERLAVGNLLATSHTSPAEVPALSQHAPAENIVQQKIHKRELVSSGSQKTNLAIVLAILGLGTMGAKAVRRGRRFGSGKLFIMLLLLCIGVVLVRKPQTRVEPVVMMPKMRMILPPPTDPVITVIMPCFKQAKYISEALNSVFDQTYKRWELILVDDQSPDKCFEQAADFIRNKYPFLHHSSQIVSTEGFNVTVPEMMLQQYQFEPMDCHPNLACPSRIRVLRNEKNVGLATTRNAALGLARTEWILTLDADDKIHPAYMLSAVHEMKVNPALGIISGVSQQFFEGSTWTWWLPGWSPRQVVEKGPFPVATFFRRSDWEKVGGYNAFLPWGNEDWTFWIALSWLPGIQTRLIALDPVIAGPMQLKSKVNSAFTYYRYKQASMAREKEEHKQECEAMMKTLHPHPFGPEKVVEAHNIIIQHMSEQSVKIIERNTVVQNKRLGRMGEVALWMGLWWEHRASSRKLDGNLYVYKSDPILALNKAKQWYLEGLTQRQEHDWQLYWRLGIVQHKLKSQMEEKLPGDPEVDLNVVQVGGVVMSAQDLCERALQLAGLFLYGKMAECINP
jgi:glycosyltransferase involved in cell wall biosynthesis